MRNAEKSTCSAVGNPFEPFFDARISKSISTFASRDRIGKPAFLITRLAQSRRENIKLFLANSLRRSVRHVASPNGCTWQDRSGAGAPARWIGHLRCAPPEYIPKHCFGFPLKASTIRRISSMSIRLPARNSRRRIGACGAALPDCACAIRSAPGST